MNTSLFSLQVSVNRFRQPVPDSQKIGRSL
jgi:hypothetical protein